ncbi:MAG: ATP synthase F0 subunit B [Clostridia bacterium]|nr:ATP synthase F0 subunit B [Clostridia bacterium]
MNIQPSVIIWTVICFVLLMLILHNWLFKPVLKMLDSRRSKIESAKEKKAEIARILAENAEKYEKDKQAYDEAQRLRAKEEARLIQSEGKKRIDQAQKECLAEIEKYKESITDEYDEIVSLVAPKMETAAAIFAKNIISHRI